MSGSWSQTDNETCYTILDEDGNSDQFCSARCEAMVLPLFIEVTWPHGVRAALYLIGLLYSFFGISIVSDLFMGAIEKITSSTKKITLASGGDGEGPEVIEVPVWNGTVANLTLMALGKFNFTYLYVIEKRGFWPSIFLKTGCDNHRQIGSRPFPTRC